MIIDIDYFHQLIPEYVALPGDARFETLESIAETRVQGPDWDLTNQKYAIALLVAHMLKISESNGKHGTDSEKDGDLAANYHIPEVKDFDISLAQTSYGVEYINLRNSIPFVNPVV